MQINRLEVKDWRGLASTALEFSAGITIIGGPNESGKTSLRSALRAALLLPTGKRNEGKILEAHRPWETRLYPTVKLDLSLGDKRCEIEKQFLRKKDWASLTVDGRRMAADDEVQAKLTQLLGPAAEWIDVLWGEQGNVALDHPPPETVKGRLAQAAQDTVMPQVAELHRLILDEFGDCWTEKTRKPNAAFQQTRQKTIDAEKELRLIKDDIQLADERVDQLSKDRQELDRLQSQATKIEQDWQRGQESLGAWETFSRMEKDAQDAHARNKTLENWINTWKSHLQEILRLWPESQKWKIESAALKERLEKQPSRAEIEALAARSTYLGLSIAEANFNAAESMAVPAQSELQRMKQVRDNLRDIEARLKMGELRAQLFAESKITVSLSRDDAAADSISLDKDAVENWTAEKGFELNIPGIAKLKVDSGNPSTANDISQRAEYLNELSNKLKLWQADSLDQLLDRAAEKELKLKQFPKVDKRQLEASRALVADADALDANSIEQKEQILRTLPSLIEAAEAKWNAEQRDYQAALAAQQKLNESNPVTKSGMILANLQTHRQSAPLEETRGELVIPDQLTDEFLAKLSDHEKEWLLILEAKKLQATQIQQALVRPAGDEVSKERLKILLDEKTAMNKKCQDLSALVNQTIGNIEAQSGLHERFVRATENVAKCEAEETRMMLDADASKMLLEAFEEVRDRLQQDVVAPLQTRVTEYFSNITSGFYSSVKFDSALKLSTVATGKVDTVALEDVSFGTREQLALLTRLCLAELLSKEEKQVIILDDNLVHTDDMRMDSACRLLENAAESVQIIIFTCHPERYKQMAAAKQISVGAR